MTETLEPVAEPVIRRPNRLTQAVAWVGIVAGVLFVVTTIFFTGFVLGRHSDGGGDGRHGHARLFHHGPPMEPGMMPPPPPGMEPGMTPPPVPTPPSQSQSPSTPPARP